jgi:2-polyprenyl-3-methyl-5-hydroxy-6-metoxy-1,4-benzoquinol methylase
MERDDSLEVSHSYNWDRIYTVADLKDLGWYLDGLDPDVEIFLKDNTTIRTILDIGTGPGTQAQELHSKGYAVTGTDISKTAINLAKEKYTNIEFCVDNILDSSLDEKYDLILDRGCFHGISVDDRDTYIASVLNLLNKRGFLLLKCFSAEEKEAVGPFRFSRSDIEDIFGKVFDIQGITDSYYYRNTKPYPLALFCILRVLDEWEK